MRRSRKLSTINIELLGGNSAKGGVHICVFLYACAGKGSFGVRG